MSEFLCIVLVILLAVVYWWARFEIRRLRGEVAKACLDISVFDGRYYEAKLRAESAARTAHNTLDRAREMFAPKDDVEALAAALGLERYYSPEENGWRKKAK